MISRTFFDSFDIQNIDEQTPFISQLVQIVEKFNTKDIEANEKLMAQSEKKFENKVLEKVSTIILVIKVEFQALVQILEEIVNKMKDMYNILCVAPRFTNEFQANIQKIQVDMNLSRKSISQLACSSSMHYNRLLFAQGRLVELHTTNRRMHSKLISIKLMLIPHLEIM